MQDGKWPALSIIIIPADCLKSHVVIKARALLILFVHINIFCVHFCNGKIHKLLANAFTSCLCVNKQHFYFLRLYTNEALQKSSIIIVTV